LSDGETAGGGRSPPCRLHLRECRPIYLQDNVAHVVFDFEDTRFMDSSGIGIIMGRYRKIACFGGRVYAIHVDKQIQRMFTLSGLNKIVEVLA